MYLYRRHYVQRWEHNDGPDGSPEWEVTVRRRGQALPLHQLDPAKISHVTEQVAYWRKVNAIHQFFVNTCQDGKDECQESYVSEETLRELLRKCRLILAADAQSREAAIALAEEELPTKSGFFFGDTSYDCWYFRGLKDTVEMLAPMVDETPALASVAAEADGSGQEVGVAGTVQGVVVDRYGPNGPGFEGFFYQASW